jgi:hypothetical protein
MKKICLLAVSYILLSGSVAIAGDHKDCKQCKEKQCTEKCKDTCPKSQCPKA